MIDLSDGGSGLCEEAFSRVQPCLQEDSFLVYKDKEAPVPKDKKGSSEKTNMSSSMICIGEEKRNAATRSTGGGKNGIQRAEIEDVRMKVDEEEVTMLSKEVDAEYF